MATPAERMLADLLAKYAEQAPHPAFARLYEDDQELGHVFAVLHRRLNQHFSEINGRAKSTHHYWADNSRDLLALIDELNEDLYELKRAGIEVTLAPEYQEALDVCEPWLSQSGGSTVPDDFQQLTLIKYEPVFRRDDIVVSVKQREALPLTLVGEGSYAQVFTYTDPNYEIQFAIKRARREITTRDLTRFKQEFAIMKRLSFPYVLQVYQYDEDRNQYSMEFCEETLRRYVGRRNDRLAFSVRKRIALQFLYGMNYLHQSGLLHRDVSLQNVLVKVFESGAVLVKLSDFGLAKDPSSDFTRSGSEMRGTIRDPQLHEFKDYSAVNEIYSVGWILSYVFTGRESLSSEPDGVGLIVRKCTAQAIAERYQTILDLIADVERLASTPTGAPA